MNSKINRERLLNRFLQYVGVDTTAALDSDTYPSTPGQLELGKLVLEQIQAMGIQDAKLDSLGILTATLPGNTTHAAPTIVFNSHFDTSPETTGKDVQPNVIEHYEGGDIQLSGDPQKIITVSDNPELNDLHGCTLITTDGTTLLGGDDKAGIAIIMEMANVLMDNRDIPHGPIRLLFTCDEEIGHGIDHVDVESLAATACYTLDGGGKGMVDVETFSADEAIVEINGVNIHPSIGKNRLVNAIRIAADLIQELPAETSPEKTEGREGFYHPYVMEGGVDRVQLRILLRSFDQPELKAFSEKLESIAVNLQKKYPGSSVHLDVNKQYRNLGDGLKKDPRIVEFAIRAHQDLGFDVRKTVIRGGTDGSGLTERGLPTPNLSSGQHNPHSPLEWACLDEMVQAAEVIVQLARIWGEPSSASPS